MVLTRAALWPGLARGAAAVPGASLLRRVLVGTASLGALAVPAHPAAAAPFSASASVAATRLLSSGAAAIHAPSSGGGRTTSFKPTRLQVKVGSASYLRLKADQKKLPDMDKTELLKALKADNSFGPLFKGVALAACRVYVLKGKLAADKMEPDAAEEAPKNLYEFKGEATLSKVVEAVGCDGETLWVHVTLPASSQKPAQPSSVDNDSLSIRAIPALSDSHHISRLVAAIRSGKVTEGAIGQDGKRVDDHLRLPEGLAWPIATNNVLFVRKYYAPLLESVLGFCKAAEPGEPSSTQRRIVTGQPGIGKSVWAWYVVYRMLREHPHRTIIVATGSTGKVYIIPPHGPIRGSILQDFKLEKLDWLEDLGPEPLLIADSLLPPELDMPTLVVSSPGRLTNSDLQNTLNSYDASWHYMPIPSEEEVLDMNAVCFGGKDVEGVKRRMSLWGPIPRHVLVYPKAHSQRAFWRRAQSVPLDKLVALARGLEAGASSLESAPHHIVHERAAGQDVEPGTPALDITSAEYYDRGKVVLASPSIMLYVAERIAEEARSETPGSLSMFP